MKVIKGGFKKGVWQHDREAYSKGIRPDDLNIHLLLLRIIPEENR